MRDNPFKIDTSEGYESEAQCGERHQVGANFRAGALTRAWGTL